jgi:hypothetical protein
MLGRLRGSRTPCGFGPPRHEYRMTSWAWAKTPVRECGGGWGRKRWGVLIGWVAGLSKMAMGGGVVEVCY